MIGSASVQFLIMVSNVVLALGIVVGTTYSWLSGGIVRRVARALVMIEKMSKQVEDLDGWRGDVNLTLVGLARAHEDIDESIVMERLDTGLDSSVIMEQDGD